MYTKPMSPALQYGVTALWYASAEDHPETVKVLLKFGAEVDLPFDVR